MKRKFDLDSEDVAPQVSKQQKMIPFPAYEPDYDVAMSDSSSDADMYTLADNHHVRLSSSASTTSASSASSDGIDFASPLFPRYNAGNASQSGYDSLTVGLLQPVSSFTHHGTSCNQIPKLRVACSAGLDGTRTMWSFCEQCGAISQVDSE